MIKNKYFPFERIKCIIIITAEFIFDMKKITVYDLSVFEQQEQVD